VRGRVVEQDAFVDLESTENSVFYAIVDADPCDRIRLSAGTSYQSAERDGVLWAGLPYWYSDGTRTTTISLWPTKASSCRGRAIRHTASLRVSRRKATNSNWSANTPDWNVSLGWTHYSAKDADDQDVAVVHPRRLLKLFTKYAMPGALRGFDIGGGLAWESAAPANDVLGEW
jgi:outer membrane receptor for ferric coprogen and ferric-rhodotorulic acid